LAARMAYRYDPFTAPLITIHGYPMPYAHAENPM
jgi:hypothetical protein